MPYEAWDDISDRELLRQLADYRDFVAPLENPSAVNGLDDLMRAFEDAQSQRVSVAHERTMDNKLRGALAGQGSDDLAAIQRMVQGEQPLQSGVADLNATRIRRDVTRRN